MKASELSFVSLPIRLSRDHLAVLCAYTHDNQSGVQRGNLYYELNAMLRARGVKQRAEMMRVWGGFMFFIMAALAALRSMPPALKLYIQAHYHIPCPFPAPSLPLP